MPPAIVLFATLVLAAPAESESVSVATARADTVSLAAPAAATPVPPRTRRDYVAEVRANFTPDNRSYSRTRVALSFITPVYGVLMALLVLFSGLAAKLRDIAHVMGRRLYVRVLIFLVLYLAVDFLLAFPLAWYHGFALEHQYGLSNQSFPAWLGEQGKSLVVGVAFFGVVPIVWLAYRAIARWPRGWWLAVALATLPLILAGALLQPLLVDPLFNKFTPLRDQALRTRIVALAERAGIPGRNVYEVDRSAQTKKYNAYVNGFGASQRIVLWDTMLRGMNADEILFVMGHEMGHYKLGHIWKGVAASAALSFVLLFLVAGLTRWAIRRWGDPWGFHSPADVASMPLLSAALTLVTFLAQPLTNGFTRAIEHEADVFAVELTRDNDAGARAFLKLGSQNRSDPEPAPFVKLLLYTHPPLIERIRFALDYRPWERGQPNDAYR
jgi:Zn-dependent protease with chaperone function